MTYRNKKYYLVNKMLVAFLFAILAITSCKRPHTDDLHPDGNLTHQLVLRDSFSIKADSFVNINKYVQLISFAHTKKEYLVCYQPTQDATNFHIYDFGLGKYISTISFDKDGVNGVGQVSPFATFIDFQNIILYGNNSNIFFITDSLGKIKRKIDLNRQEEFKGVAYPQPAFPSVIKNGRLHFFVLPSFEANKNRLPKNAKPEWIYDLSSKKVHNEGAPYPNYPLDYFNSIEAWKAARCFGPNDEEVYSFAFDNNLYVNVNGTVTTHEIENKSLREINESSLSLSDFQAQMNFISRSGLYTYLFFDPYRNLYYRIFLMPGEFKHANGKTIMLAERDFKIEVIDLHFKLIGSTLFQGKEFNPYRLLISKRGLVLERNNFYTPSTEDFFKFCLFDVKPL